MHLGPAFFSRYLLLLFKQMLAVIHDPANWWLRHRCNLNQINSRFLGQYQGFADALDAERFSVFTNQPDFRGVDFFVYALRLLQCDGFAPYSDKN